MNDLVPEEQGLLSDAAEPAFDSPAHQLRHHEAASQNLAAKNILVETTSTFLPSTSQLQRAINQGPMSLNFLRP